MTFPTRQHTLLPVSLALTALVAACSSGSSGGGVDFGSAEGTGDVLVQDAPADQLLAFEATVRALFLRTGAVDTANLLPASLDVELIGLQSRFGWLGRLPLPAGTYDSLVIQFETGSYTARDAGGMAVGVVATSDELVVPFDAPIVVTETNYHRFEVDVDLGSSISGDVGSPPLVFDPTGSVTQSDGAMAVRIDGIKGVVQSFDASDREIVVAARSSDFLQDRGELVVDVTADTLLFRESGLAYASLAEFFEDLSEENTALEINGWMGRGARLTASKIEVEDQTAGAGSSGEVELEGFVLATSTRSTSFDLKIRRIVKGADVAEPVLTDDEITVRYSDAATNFFLQGEELARPGDLTPGQEVTVEFSAFVSEPFFADQVEIDQLVARFQATVTSVEGLPDGAVVLLPEQSPAITGGLVTDAETDVMLDLTGAMVVMGLDSQPQMDASSLQPEIEIEVTGTFSGEPGTPALTAVLVEVHPGRLDEGTVAAADDTTSSFSTTGGEVAAPFGAGITSGPLDVVIDPSCTFHEDVSTEAEFFDLFGTMAQGQIMVVQIEGLATGNEAEIRAYRIRARLIDQKS